ncbi:Ketopantoate reductase ApbA/PanE [Cordyceps fumosorosea ARSEF 2679]|uniref:Ketopantoate reductase ApbA/PanE n=1 Tax=Cordyceps fumosorosea (strain ARSEF 2679) TaxID=1081104 RepID=A0A162N225_CORFA|nr:Ketopantoate reductase ApbA/PanE [Cordyceps fumosorosea ARSEF 2679]OAA74249.1 Ketopantoate reductase ApbA/PanE [Cordyceps fumosorosea ARSEF 2679]
MFVFKGSSSGGVIKQASVNTNRAVKDRQVLARTTHSVRLCHSVYTPRSTSTCTARGPRPRNSRPTNARCLLVEDIVGARWAKLLWDAPFNTLCTVLRIPVGELLSGPGSGRAAGAGDAGGRSGGGRRSGYGDAASEDMFQTMLHDSAPTSTFRPSMLVDLENGRPLELEVILGAPLRVAKEKGVSTAILTRVYKLLNLLQWKLT